MHSISIFILSCCLLAVSDCLDDNDHEIINGDSALGTTTQQPQQQQKRRATTIPPPNFLDLPEDIIIEYEDASSYINNQNHNIEHMMGVSDERCDNARKNLATDFDPENQTEIELNSVCFEAEQWQINKITPVLTVVILPPRYVPIHRCMRVKINYIERVPTIGPHRPLWARYGEYTYLPPQRWLHNVEHGAIIALYHPCADQDEVNKLKSAVKKCLWRHIITPFPTLTRERPLALVGWSAHLEMSHFDHDLVVNFTKFYARTGPERIFRDGQYHHLLVEEAQIVTNIIDSSVCPDV